MKKTSFVVALLVSAALAGCHKKSANTTPTTGTTSGSAMAPDTGSAAAPAGSDATGGGAAGGGSAM